MYFYEVIINLFSILLDRFILKVLLLLLLINSLWEEEKR